MKGGGGERGGGERGGKGERGEGGEGGEREEREERKRREREGETIIRYENIVRDVIKGESPTHVHVHN